MSDFRVCSVDSAIEFAIENDATANPRSHRDVDQPLAIPASAPSGLGQSSGIAIVFECYPKLEDFRQVLDRPLPPPSGQKINIAEFSTHRIHRPGRPNADAGQFNSSFLLCLAQHARD